MKTLTYDRALELLTEIVDERPHHIYELPPDHFDSGLHCAYADTQGNPSCIVGHFLHREGFNLEPEEGEHKWVHEGVTADIVVGLLYDDVNKHALHLLSEVQFYQDEGLTWRSSLDTALEDAREKDYREIK